MIESNISVHADNNAFIYYFKNYCLISKFVTLLQPEDLEGTADKHVTVQKVMISVCGILVIAKLVVKQDGKDWTVKVTFVPQ